MIKKITILLLLIPAVVLSQEPSLKINGYITDNYPDITVLFTAFTAGGDQLSQGDFNDEDVWITENGVDKNGTVYCAPEGLSKFSTILVMDRSGSMTYPAVQGGSQTKFELAKLAAETWITEIPNFRFECALMSFELDVLLVRDFTDNKLSLLQGLESDSLKPVGSGGTNYNAAFLQSQRPPFNYGALKVGEHAKYPLYIIFLTDGGHNSLDGDGKFHGDDIYEKAQELGATIYSVVMLKKDTLTPIDIERIESISDRVYYGQDTESEIKATYREILSQVKKTAPPPPCEFTYKTDCDGGGDIVLHVRNDRIDISAPGHFEIPDDVKPGAAYEPKKLGTFINVPLGSRDSKQFTMTAERNFIEFYGPPQIDDGQFSITDPPGWDFTINGDESRQFTVQYEPATDDSVCYETDIIWNSSMCSSGTFTVRAGWFIVRPVNMGSVNLGESGTLDYKEVICNRTCEDIEIEEISLTGDDKDAFGILTSPLPEGVLPDGGCLDMRFSFTPTENKDYSATIRIKTNKGVFENEISGKGSGYAEITANDILNYRNIRCDDEIIDSIVIENPGALLLLIDRFEVSSPFEIVEPAPEELKPGEKVTLYIKFSPGKSGSYNEILTIFSNANGDPEYKVNLNAVKDSIYFETDREIIDFGVICPQSPASDTLILTTPGATTGFYVDASVDGGLSIDNIGGIDRHNLDKDSETLIPISVSNPVDGEYQGKITLVDECGNERQVEVKWIVSTPLIEYSYVEFNANIPGSDTKEVIIKNTSEHDIYISEIEYSEMFFFSEDQDIKFPILIKKGQSININVVYKPGSESDINAEMLLTGSPCNFTQAIDLSGNPGLSTVHIGIDEHTGIVGEIVRIPIYLDTGNNFASSMTEMISTKVLYNENLLEFVSVEEAVDVSDNNGVIALDNIPVKPIDTYQVIANLNFRVLSGPPITTSLIIEDTRSVSPGSAVYIPNNGKFSLLPVSAEVIIGTVQGIPGEKVKIPVTVTGFTNYKADVNKNLYVTFSFEKTILACDDGSINCIDNGTDRSATFKIPLADNGKTDINVEKSFTAMLGTTKETPLHIEDVYLEEGEISTVNTDGHFSLVVCEEGGSRLFDPNAEAAAIIIPAPNPANSDIEIRVTTPEKGQTEIIITDLLGAVIKKVTLNLQDPGTYREFVNVSGLQDGTYMITLKTPTKVVSERLFIIK